jgi:hypothetical protein
MGLLAWTWRTIRDTGEPVPVPVGLERTPGVDVAMGAETPAGTPLYVFRIGLRAGFDGVEAGIPVYRRVNESPHPILKEIHFCEVAGTHLEAANVYALKAKVQQVLETLAPGGMLPLCYFEVPGSDYSLAVYQEGRDLVAPVLAGPKIRARDLGAIREPAIRHLRTAGYLHHEQEPDVRVVRPSDLRLVAPAAVIRSIEDRGLWLPTVEGVAGGTPVIGLITTAPVLEAGRGRRPEPSESSAPPHGPDVTGLLRLLGAELNRVGELSSPWHLYAAQVRPEIWAWTERLTDSTGRMLVAYLEGEESPRLELPVRHTAAGESVAGLEEAGISVFMGGDEEALCAIVGRYLCDAGFIHRPEDLRAEEVGTAPGPETLPVDEIRTNEIWPTPQEVTT